MFVGLNPSTADENLNDPTIRRCINFCKKWGYGSMYMLNIFAYRATDPKVMKMQEDSVGPENNSCLEKITRKAGIVIAAWGIHGGHRNRDKEAMGHLHKLHTIGFTKHGYPSHPLYLRADLFPIPWIGELYADD